MLILKFPKMDFNDSSLENCNYYFVLWRFGGNIEPIDILFSNGGETGLNFDTLILCISAISKGDINATKQLKPRTHFTYRDVLA